MANAWRRQRSGAWVAQVVATCTGVLAAGLTPLVIGAGAADAGGPPTATTSAQASRLATANGARVEVLGLTTERSQTFAEPNGTFTTELSTTVDRVRRGNSWTPVDTTLEARPDGKIAPRATASDVVLSGGGTGSFVHLGVGAGALDMTAPWSLPMPNLSGPTATYADVLPGVDLVAKVAAEGFSYNIVVKNRQAAGNPALRSLRFPVSSSGLGLRTDQPNRPQYVDATGRLVLTVGEAVMWDSAGAAPAGMKSSAAAVDELPVGGNVAEMDLRGDAQGLTIVPDSAMLTAPDTVFPVVLDPNPVTTKDRTSWTAAWELYPDISFFKTQHSLGVGYEAYEQFKRVRAFFQFDIPTGLFGKLVTAAEFRTHEVHSASCAAREVTVSRTNPITTSTTWNNQPAWQADVAKKSFAYGWSSDCVARDVGFDVTGSVKYTVDHNSRTTTLRMRASNEADPLGWKQFDSTGKLSVNYVSKPATPTGLGVSESPGYPRLGCGTEADPAIFRAVRPQLSAYGRGGDADRNVKVRFETYNANNSLWTLLSGDTRPNVLVSRQFDSALGNGIYRYRARTEYTYDGGTQLSSWTGWCYFRIDTTRPVAPTVTATYNGVALQNCATVEVGQDCPMAVPFGGVVTYTVTGVSADAVKTWYYWRGDENIIAGRNLTVSLTTPAQGLVTFTARSVDGAGLQSPSAMFRINVGPPPGPVGEWTFDNPSGPTVPDTGSSPHPIMLNGGTHLTAQGRMAGSVMLGGGADYASTSAPAVDTSASFSVAAWVRSADDGEGAVACAEGSRGSGFRLYRMAADGRWAFARNGTDTDGASITRAVSDQPSVFGAWTHVAGVFNASAKTMTLYVNGRIQGSPVPYTGTAWKATGPLSIGKYKFDGTYGGWLTGSIDHLQIWSRAISAGEAFELANPRSDGGSGDTIAGEIAHWPLDSAYTIDNENWYTSDVDYGAGMRLDGFGTSPAAAFASEPDLLRGGSVLSMTSGRALSLGRPVVDVGTSFTVTAWVRMGQDAPAGTILRQAGANADLWKLDYRPGAADSAQFVFTRLREDSASEAPAEVSATVDRAEASSGWSLLVGIYDAETNEISLHLESVLLDKLAVGQGSERRGSTVAGKANRAGATGFAGLLDDIRIYAGVKPENEICTELMGSSSCNS